MAYTYENRHDLKEHDFSILDKLEFKIQPVGFSFFNTQPEAHLGLEKLDESIAWCRMLTHAQDGNAFYATEENQYCEPGVFLCGYQPPDPIASGGLIGPAFEIFYTERANRRIYDHLTYLKPGSVHSVAFAPLDKLKFDPDLLILTTDNMAQTERILRATQFDTGDVIESKMTYVMGCNWLFTYPYVTGKINYMTTGVCYGMKMYKLYQPGIQIIIIPWMHIDRVLKNMREMPWTVPGHTDQKEEFYKVAHARLGVEQII